MNDTPNYQPMKKVEPPLDPVARSIAKPSAFAKAGTMGTKAAAKGPRFRPLATKATPGRPRKKRDPRYVQYY